MAQNTGHSRSPIVMAKNRQSDQRVIIMIQLNTDEHAKKIESDEIWWNLSIRFWKSPDSR